MTAWTVLHALDYQVDDWPRVVDAAIVIGDAEASNGVQKGVCGQCGRDLTRADSIIDQRCEGRLEPRIEVLVQFDERVIA